MSAIQLSPDREATAHTAAKARMVQGLAKARVNRVLSREPHLVSAFALQAEIEVITARANELCDLHDSTTANILRATAARLRALLPTAY